MAAPGWTGARTVMGIYDRDYYRKEGQSFLGSLAERGTVCKWLIGINVVCFILQLITTEHQRGSWFTDALILDVGKVLHGEVWRILTYAFLHSVGSVWHILINLLLLYFFGRDIEDAYGSPRFFTTCPLAAGLGGSLFVATLPATAASRGA